MTMQVHVQLADDGGWRCPHVITWLGQPHQQLHAGAGRDHVLRSARNQYSSLSTYRPATMAPNKGKARVTPPDDETPAAPLIRSSEELNLSVLRRHYPEVVAIHYVAPYAVLYVYTLELAQWEKIGMEGSLFVCELVPSSIGAERFAVILLNRRGLENFFMEIKSPEDIEFDEFIMMQSDQVYGLWIYSEPSTSTANVPSEIKAKLLELAARAEESRKTKERETESGGTDVEQVETSIPMGRQLSLRELFGQQRQTEATAVIQSHNNTHSVMPPGPRVVPGAPPGLQPDVLSQLFMKAKQDYNGFG